MRIKQGFIKGGSTCPACGRAISYTGKNRKFRLHMPYERKSEADLLDRGRPCIGSGKTYPEAMVVTEERTRRRQDWFRSLPKGRQGQGRPQG